MEQFALHTDLFADDNLSHFDFHQHQALTATATVQNPVLNNSSYENVQNTPQTLDAIVAQVPDTSSHCSGTNAFHTTSSLSFLQPTNSVPATSSLFADDLSNSTAKPLQEFSVGNESYGFEHAADTEYNVQSNSYELDNNFSQSSAESERLFIHSNDTHEQEQHAAEQLVVPDVEKLTNINNVVCTYNTRCHLNLKRVAMEGANVIFKRENNMVNMKLRKPKATASIWSSGKITCTGSESEDGAHTAARRIARQLQKMGFRVRFANYRVVNVLGTCFLPFAIKLTSFSAENKAQASYEPELHPGVTYKMKEPKATLKIFSTGSITVTASRVASIYAAVRNIYPLVYAHKLEKAALNPRELEMTQQYLTGNPAVRKSSKAKTGYQQFRYTKRSEGEDSYDSESSYGEDSDSD